jgi:hypothetical protein
MGRRKQQNEEERNAKKPKKMRRRAEMRKVKRGITSRNENANRLSRRSSWSRRCQLEDELK